jgi:hypothetical protein
MKTSIGKADKPWPWLGGKGFIWADKKRALPAVNRKAFILLFLDAWDI